MLKIQIIVIFDIIAIRFIKIKQKETVTIRFTS